MLAMLVDVDLIDGVWIATAPWMPSGTSCTGASFEAVFDDVIRLKPRGWRHGG